ncbi:pyridoxal phosphate-dependent transferase [Limtongia smithiae]|uniref:pyridoxal phosphate-dependent transferase n=1 Tax=Limtongia smithiae TaxID=1125753 RepID=UPI0034CD508E
MMIVTARPGGRYGQAVSRSLSAYRRGYAAKISLDRATAKQFDSEDVVAGARNLFLIPTRAEITANANITDPNSSSIYFAGNSLGLQPKRTRELLSEELDIWAKNGVHGHFRHSFGRPWMTIDETVTGISAAIVGARVEEVAVMTTLTTNLHLLLSAFYRPEGKRTKIIIEEKAFPSDHYAVESQIMMHGYNVDETLVTIKPSNADSTVSKSHVLDVISEHADTAAVVLLPGIQYYTGQAFDIKEITSYAKSLGIVVGWDLAHAVGNLQLSLHDWNVDFAVWCSYKYLNSGPGGIGGLFVHEHNFDKPRLVGWWAHDKKTRFLMNNKFAPSKGASAFQLSNPSVLDTVSLLGSLEVFDKYPVSILRAKSLALTGYLESLLLARFPDKPFAIITPSDPDQRGAQLSLLFKTGLMEKVNHYLTNNGITCDERRPDVIRVAPAPLYNTFEEVWVFVDQLRTAIDAV